MMKLRLFLPLLLVGLSVGTSYGSYKELMKRVEAFEDEHYKKTIVVDKNYGTLLHAIVNCQDEEVYFAQKARALRTVGEGLWNHDATYRTVDINYGMTIVRAIEDLVSMHFVDIKNNDTVSQVNGVKALVELIEKGASLTYPKSDQRVPVALKSLQSRILKTNAGEKFRAHMEEEERLAEEAKRTAQQPTLAKAHEKSTAGTVQLLEKGAEKPARFTFASKLMLFSAITATIACIGLFAFQNRHDLLSGKFSVKTLWPMKRGVKALRA